jgi:NADH-quinone oxidoreductase subunit H
MNTAMLIAIGIALGKALFYALFALTLAVVLTWADRRQGAMIQDRIGPNRAVIFMPGKLAALGALLPALGLGALVLWWTSKTEFDAGARGTAAIALSQLAILLTWVTAVVIAGRVRVRGVRSSFDLFVRGLGDPRRFVAVGLALHAITLAAGVVTQGQAEGVLLQEIGFRSGAALLAFVVVGGALYLANLLAREPRIGLRLMGLLHPAADGLKSIFKEDIVPPSGDRLVHGFAPIIAFFPALIVMAVIPFGDRVCLGPNGDVRDLLLPLTAACGGRTFSLQLLELDVGLLFFFALGGTGIIGAALAGWSSNNKYSLLGGLRAASQMVSYEVTMGLTLVGALMLYGTLRIDEMIEWQGQNAWGVFVQPVAFVLFFAAAVAETKRIPFDLPEGESEIVAGYYTEYSGMKFAMFFFAEYIAVVTSSALMVAMFFGGWDLPFLERSGLRVVLGESIWLQAALPHLVVILLGVLGFIAKTLLLCWLQLLVRWTLPRFRYDQLMNLGWRKLLPWSLVNILATGLIVMVLTTAGPVVQEILVYLAQFTRFVVAAATLMAVIAGCAFILKPAAERRKVATTSAKFAEMLGGTPNGSMGA